MCITQASGEEKLRLVLESMIFLWIFINFHRFTLFVSIFGLVRGRFVGGFECVVCCLVGIGALMCDAMRRHA